MTTKTQTRREQMEELLDEYLGLVIASHSPYQAFRPHPSQLAAARRAILDAVTRVRGA